MVKQYSKMADEVIVVVSDPKKKVRPTKTGKVVTAEMSKKIWELYIKDAGLKNVKVVVSDVPSPMVAGSEYARYKLKNVNLILGASDKGNDAKRWAWAPKFFEKENPDIYLIPPSETAVKSTGDISASYIRDNIDDKEKIKDLFPDDLSDKDLDKIIKMLT